jgi:hypothetical protein
VIAESKDSNPVIAKPAIEQDSELAHESHILSISLRSVLMFSPHHLTLPSENFP